MEITPPKKKLSLFWLSFFLFCLLLVAFLFQLVGPNPTIRVAKDTTYLTEGIESDGFPNYARHAIDRAREGVTPENNAAVLIAQAMWPMDLKPEHYEPYCAAMGMEVPTGENTLVDVASQEMSAEIEAWLIDRYRLAHEDELAEMERSEDEHGDDWLDIYFHDKSASVFGTEALAYVHPFTPEQFPAMAKWVMANQAPLDKIVDASQRPRFFQSRLSR